MIRFTLKCPDDHVFESWFKSSAAFDALADQSMITCPQCGAPTREKALMAPDVRPARNAAVSERATENTAIAMPSNEMEAAINEMRKKVEENSDYVGNKFADEARAIHLGDAPERSIYGEASKDEAKQLVEDGVPVLPLPFVPDRKVN